MLMFTSLWYLQVGDGTTTVVLFAGEFLKEAKPFIEDGVHPQNLIRSYRSACQLVRHLVFTFNFTFPFIVHGEGNNCFSELEYTFLEGN